MTTLVSRKGATEVINARRTESLDAPSILKLVKPSTEELFGRVNVVNLIEKAVLAITLSNERDEVLAHSAFFDYPNVPNVDSAKWEDWLKSNYDTKNCNPLNTLFMHYFVAKSEYSHGAAREIIRTMYNAVPEAHFCFLVVPNGVFPDSALAAIFQQMEHFEETKGPEGCVVFACHRHQHVPVLHVRKAIVEDHDDLTPIFNRQSDMLKMTYGEYFLAELIEAQDENMQCLVAEVEGTAIGFMSICDDVNVDLLNTCFELGSYHGLRKPHPEDELEPPAPKQPSPQPPPEPVSENAGDEERPSSARSAASAKSATSVKSDKGSAVEKPAEENKPEGSVKSPTGTEGGKDGEVQVQPKLADSNIGGSRTSLLSEGKEAQEKEEQGSVKSAASAAPSEPKKPAETQMKPPTASTASKHLSPVMPKMNKSFVPQYKGALNAISIQLFIIDERYEMRSTDFLPKAFELFPDRDFAVITVPHLVPEFPLLQKMVRATPRCPSILSQELYLFHRAGLIRDFKVRPACTSDFGSVEKLVSSLDLHENLLADLKQFNKARRDADGTPIQAFVADCSGQVVGIAIIRNEEDIEFIRSHYNIEDFVYFNHHRRDEHGHVHHFAMNPAFQHYSKHFLKEVLRLGHKTCLYYPIYPSYSPPEIVEKHSLITSVNDLVPVRARRQITYPVENLKENAPSERILQQREAYALCHINRKLTLEPKVVINARIVVVGASDTGLAFLETLVFCPHLRFNNLTLVSPRGLPGELPPDQVKDQLLGHSFCYDQEDYAKSSLRTWVNVVYGKMTNIDRKKKKVPTATLR